MATIEIVGVSKQFALSGHRPRNLKEWAVRQLTGRKLEAETPASFWALKDVSFEIEKGETFGVIGDNGSGKSTLLKLITGISKPTRGHVGVRGRISALLELGAGFHPDFSGRENVYLNAAILGLKRAEVDRAFDSIVAFAELERFIDNPVKTYSSGMYMRLAFSIAVHVDPDILVVDEVLAVGDAAFQAKCMDQIHRFKHQGKTIVFVSHSLPTVRDLCQRAAWLHQGELRALGKAETVLEFYAEQVASTMERNKEELKRLVPDGRAALRRLTAYGADGAESGMLRGDAPAAFGFELESALPASALELVCRLSRTDGVCCYDARVQLGELAEAEASGAYRIEVPELRLHTGTYSLQLNLALAGTEQWLDEKFYNFAVEADTRGSGVASLRADWRRVSAVGPAPTR